MKPLFEEFKEYENLWKPRKLTESYADDAYEALMGAQNAILSVPGVTLNDCDQDDENTMTLHCALAPETYVWYELDDGSYEYTEDFVDVENELRQLGVEMSIVDDDKDGYIRVYLSYEDYMEHDEDYYEDEEYED